jgi:hypothetical protein
MTNRQRKILIVLSAGFFVVQLDLFIVNVAFASMRQSSSVCGLAVGVVSSPRTEPGRNASSCAADGRPRPAPAGSAGARSV